MNQTLLVQISDLHIREPGRLAYGRINTAPYLEKAVAAINRLPQKPEAVVITGDLTDFGRIAEYEHLRDLLAPLTVPVYMLPGNHDERHVLAQSFPQQQYLESTLASRYTQYVVPVGPLRLITMHHPPFNTLIGHMDQIGLLEGAPELEQLLRRFNNIERVICGHLHRPISTRFGGTIASTCPAPAHQVCLVLDPNAESAWCLEPPAMQIHAWDHQAQRLVSHLAVIEEFEGPYPFHEGGKLID